MARWFLQIAVPLFLVAGCATSPEPAFLESIAARIEARRDDFAKCYEPLPRPRPKADVRVAFAYDSKGVVTEARAIEDTLKNTALTDCVLATVKTIRFPPLGDKESVQVTYPFSFSQRAAK